MKEKSLKNPFVTGAIPSEKIATSIAAHQSKTNIGAHSIFLGQVRADLKEAGTVSAISYECYEPLAIEQLNAIREEIFAQYDITCMHVYHSLGEVPVGGICLFVFTSSAHRHTCIEATNTLVERIKKEVPIWGKEIINCTTYDWKENT